MLLLWTQGVGWLLRGSVSRKVEKIWNNYLVDWRKWWTGKEKMVTETTVTHEQRVGVSGALFWPTPPPETPPDVYEGDVSTVFCAPEWGPNEFALMCLPVGWGVEGVQI